MQKPSKNYCIKNYFLYCCNFTTKKSFKNAVYLVKIYKYLFYNYKVSNLEIFFILIKKMNP